jgi:membrane fusion protein (multidrug efflux system)
MNDQAFTIERTSKGPLRPRPWRGRLVVLLVLAGLIAAGADYWFVTRDFESTDDAYTDGRAVTVAPQVAGLVVTLNVTDNQRVHAGDLLVAIDPRSYAAARDAAAANLQSAEAQLADARLTLATARVDYPARLASAQAALAAAQAVRVKAQADARRQQGLPRAATTQQEIDTAAANLQAADAQTAEAEAALRQADQVATLVAGAAAQVQRLQAQTALAQAQLDTAELNLSWTRVLAPQDGWIVRRNVEQGSYVQPGQSLFALVAPEVWVTANFKESQLRRMRPGQKVDVAVDAYPDLKLTGHVDSVQLGSGSRFTAFPPENATGNFVKIVQRVPVKLVIDSGLAPDRPLPLGLSVVPTVHVADPP